MRLTDLLLTPLDAPPQAVHSLLPFLRPGGLAIITLKFTGTGRDRSAHGSLLEELYRGVLQGGTLVWLLANTVCETTWIATKMAVPAGCMLSLQTSA